MAYLSDVEKTYIIVQEYLDVFHDEEPYTQMQLNHNKETGFDMLIISKPSEQLNEYLEGIKIDECMKWDMITDNAQKYTLVMGIGSRKGH